MKTIDIGKGWQVEFDKEMNMFLFSKSGQNELMFFKSIGSVKTFVSDEDNVLLYNRQDVLNLAGDSK